MARKKNDEIKVHVASYGQGRNLCLRYRDPRTGKAVVKSAGTTNRKAAQKEAGKWEEELRTGKYKPASKVTWTEFRARYETEYVAVEMKLSSAARVSAVFDAVERILNPGLLSSVDADAVSKLKAALREERTTLQDGDTTTVTVTRRTEETIRGHLRVIKAALKWAHKRRILVDAPEIEITAPAGSKGRPITLEEFERLLSKIDSERPIEERAQWERLLWGLWWSGLRLEEALTLTWDNPHAPYVDLDGEDSTITIPGDCQKGGKDTVGPIVPEFYEFLSQTPQSDRRGRVFPLPFTRGDTVSKVICAIGKASGVKVGPSKCASAHDLRRSFGFRWAVRVMPVLLQQLMRHASIETTLKYYVGNDAREMGKAVWRAFRATARADGPQGRISTKEATNQATVGNSPDPAIDKNAEKTGVAYGARTRDLEIHNLTL